MVLRPPESNRTYTTFPYSTLFRACEAPVRLFDQVVTADPRLVLVARGELRPQRDGLALVFLALPQRGLCGIAVGNGKVVALSARRGMEVEDQIDMVRLDRKSTRLNSSH